MVRKDRLDAELRVLSGSCCIFNRADLKLQIKVQSTLEPVKLRVLKEIFADHTSRILERAIPNRANLVHPSDTIISIRGKLSRDFP